MKKLNNNSGGVLVFVAISIVALLSMTALVIDLGQLYIAKQRAQNVADAAAIAAASKLDGTSGSLVSYAMPEAISIKDTNNQRLPSWQVSSMTVTTPNGYEAGSAVEVVCYVPVNYAFAGIMGLLQGSASAKAIAMRHVEELGLPWAPWCMTKKALFDITTEPPSPKYSPDNNALIQNPTPKVGDWKSDTIGSGNFGCISLIYDATAKNNQTPSYKDILSGTNQISLNLDSPLYIDTQPGNIAATNGVLNGNGNKPGTLTNDPYQTNSTTGATAWDQWKQDFKTWDTDLNKDLSAVPTWLDTKRLYIVPIIEDQSYNGKETAVSVIGYAAIFVEQYLPSPDNTVQAYFIGAILKDGPVNVGWTNVFLPGQNKATWVRLVE